MAVFRHTGKGADASMQCHNKVRWALREASAGNAQTAAVGARHFLIKSGVPQQKAKAANGVFRMQIVGAAQGWEAVSAFAGAFLPSRKRVIISPVRLIGEKSSGSASRENHCASLSSPSSSRTASEPSSSA